MDFLSVCIPHCEEEVTSVLPYIGDNLRLCLREDLVFEDGLSYVGDQAGRHDGILSGVPDAVAARQLINLNDHRVANFLPGLWIAFDGVAQEATFFGIIHYDSSISIVARGTASYDKILCRIDRS
jgi:hypothetical protein